MPPFVSAVRVRKAVDSLAAVQFNARGDHVWSQARVLLESEHQRLAVGQVAVPFGICTEPSNVQAGGGACPFRFRVPGLQSLPLRPVVSAGVAGLP
jgi:hypothetical protein